jgi:hypothetical protein
LCRKRGRGMGCVALTALMMTDEVIFIVATRAAATTAARCEQPRSHIDRH